jgi:hypothetical protein
MSTGEPYPGEDPIVGGRLLEGRFAVSRATCATSGPARVFHVKQSVLCRFLTRAADLPLLTRIC